MNELECFLVVGGRCNAGVFGAVFKPGFLRVGRIVIESSCSGKAGGVEAS